MKYFISYSDNTVMYGAFIYNIIIERDKPITSIEDIRDIEKWIANKLGKFTYRTINIITFKEIKND